MSKPRSLVMAMAAAAMALSSFAAPASAAEGKGVLGIVNGRPGGKVDICLGGNELRSRVPYGGRIFTAPPAGATVLRVFSADPRTCKGTLLAKKSFSLGDGADLTMVITRSAPKVVTFVNGSALGSIPPSGPSWVDQAPIVFRHAADLGDATIRAGIWWEAIPEEPLSPAADPIWRKGDGQVHVQDLEFVLGIRVRATRPDQTATLARTPIVELFSGRRYEFYLVGTSAANARFVSFSRLVSK